MQRRSRRGTTAVELSLTLPIMLGVVFGAIEYGWYYGQHGVLESAVASSCRSASLINPRRADAVAVAEAKLAAHAKEAGIDCDAPGVTCDAKFGGTVPLARLECVIDAPYQSLTGVLPTPDALVVSAAVRMEYQ